MSGLALPDPRDELLDGRGQLRGAWRQMLGTLLGLGQAALRERADDLDRAFAEEGFAATRLGPNSARWRCDPIPLLFTADEFATLEVALAQRAALLELVLADVYGPQALLRDGALPPALVLASPRFLRPCRAVGAPPGRQLRLYAADLVRAPDGRWQVLADHADCPEGLAHALENRRMVARVLPELFKSLEVAQVRPFIDILQDALQRAAPAGVGNPGLALLTPGHQDALWFEHLVLSRELSCALVEGGDLTVRDGALFLKTLRGLQPVHVLLRRHDASAIDPLELAPAGPGASGGGIPGLLDAARGGALVVVNAPGAAFAEAPGLAPFLPALCERLLGEKLLAPSVPTLWLGDAESRAEVLADPAPWVLRAALDSGAPTALPAGAAPGALAAMILEQPWRYAATRAVPPSFAPCVGADQLMPRPVVVRLFLAFDGTGWRALQGGLARVLAEEDVLTGRVPTDAPSKDVWVLAQDGAAIAGPGNLAVPALAITRTAGDLPSRVADNFFWLGRYLERLENGARLARALLARLGRGALLPRELPDVAVLIDCLAEAGIAERELSAYSGASVLTEMLVRMAARDQGGLARNIGHVVTLADLLRDRLTGDMHASILVGAQDLTEARNALRTARPSRRLDRLSAFAGLVLRFSATVAGFAAENMVRGGGRLFLDLGRRVERAQAVAGQLSRALEQACVPGTPQGSVEAGLHLALELCDSVITYRSRYLTVLQPAPVLDLVVADDGNPRSLLFQLGAARLTLEMLGGEQEETLAVLLDPAATDARAIARDVARVAEGGESALCDVPDRLRAIEASVAGLSDAITRRYFSLLPVTWTVGSDAEEAAAP
jgi:uncharacterized circularly permuted ATP-grasp superfamily protein/uncharacterized alpha-E superfamily protein